MAHRHIRATLLAALAAILISLGLCLSQPFRPIVFATVCFGVIVGVWLLPVYQKIPGSEYAKSETIRALKRRTSCFGAIAESVAGEASLLSIECTEFSDRLKMKAFHEKGALDAVERLLNQLNVLSDITASTESCLTQLQVMAKIYRSESTHQQCPFSNGFSRPRELDQRTQHLSHQLEPKSNQHKVTANVLQQFNAIIVLLRGVSRAADELRSAQNSLLSSSENLVERSRDRAARSESISLSAERIAAIFREVDFMLDLALQNSPRVQASMTAESRIENGHPNSVKHLGLKTLPGGELDRRQIVEIR